MAESWTMDDPRRARVEARLMERISRLDDSTLKELDAWLSQPLRPDEGHANPAGAAPRAGGMTRRQALAAALFGSTAIAGAGVAGGYLGQNSGTVAGAASMTGTISELQGQAAAFRERANETGQRLEEARASLSEVQGRLGDAQEVITLFDQLEGVDLDSVVDGGVSAVASAIGRTAQVAQGLREGLARAQNNVAQLDEGFAVLDNGLVRAESAVSTLSGLVQGLEDRLRAAGEPVAPLTDALGSFFTGVLRRIPFVGQQIVETIERVQAVVGAIPESIENINSDLIEPVRARFFPREGDDVTVRLLDPLMDLIFVPADRLLTNLSNLGETWQSALEAPTKEKLEQRALLREKIEALRTEKDL
jgi:uncharacterized phage infection (PIP) family protein YhgE